MPEYRPRVWELDAEGNRLPQPRIEDRNLETFGGINGLGIRGFERVCRDTGLRIARREPHAFRGPKLMEAVSTVLSRTPLLKELFTAYMIYELERPE